MGRTLSIRTEQREILARIVNAQEKVQERLLRATSALEDASVRFAVVGGNAVAVWVASRDESLVRATRDIDLLIDRTDLVRVRTALERVGFVFRHAGAMDMFLDGPDAKAGDALHVIYSGEKVLPTHLLAAPGLDEAESGPQFRVVSLDGLVRMKLVAWRDKDRVHLRDMIEVGLIDDSWLQQMPGALQDRLRSLLENPE